MAHAVEIVKKRQNMRKRHHEKKKTRTHYPQSVVDASTEDTSGRVDELTQYYHENITNGSRKDDL